MLFIVCTVDANMDVNINQDRT